MDLYQKKSEAVRSKMRTTTPGVIEIRGAPTDRELMVEGGTGARDDDYRVVRL